MPGVIRSRLVFHEPGKAGCSADVVRETPGRHSGVLDNVAMNGIKDAMAGLRSTGKQGECRCLWRRFVDVAKGDGPGKTPDLSPSGFLKCRNFARDVRVRSTWSRHYKLGDGKIHVESFMQ